MPINLIMFINQVNYVHPFHKEDITSPILRNLY